MEVSTLHKLQIADPLQHLGFDGCRWEQVIVALEYLRRRGVVERGESIQVAASLVQTVHRMLQRPLLPGEVLALGTHCIREVMESLSSGTVRAGTDAAPLSRALRGSKVHVQKPSLELQPRIALVKLPQIEAIHFLHLLSQLVRKLGVLLLGDQRRLLRSGDLLLAIRRGQALQLRLLSGVLTLRRRESIYHTKRSQQWLAHRRRRNLRQPTCVREESSVAFSFGMRDPHLRKLRRLGGGPDNSSFSASPRPYT
eukprot:scaffold1866_cov277-Pinguiococcus_pyrenoidosus.AAC.7